MAGQTYTLTINVTDDQLKALNAEVETLNENLNETGEEMDSLHKKSDEAGGKLTDKTKSADAAMVGLSGSVRAVGSALKAAFSAGILVLITGVVAAFQKVQFLVDIASDLQNAFTLLTQAVDEFARGQITLAELWDRVINQSRELTEQQKDARLAAIALVGAIQQQGLAMSKLAVDLANINLTTEQRNKLTEDAITKENELSDLQLASIQIQLNALDILYQADLQNIDYLEQRGMLMNELAVIEQQHIINLTDINNLNKEGKILAYESLVIQLDYYKELNQRELELEIAEQGRESRYFESQERRIRLEEQYVNYGIDQRLAALEELGLQETMAYQELLDEKLFLDREYAQQYKDLEKAKVEYGIQQGQAALGAASSAFGMLAELYADDFEKQKKFKIAQAVVDTIQGAVAAYTGAASIPVVGVAIGAILAALVLATGFKQIQKIKATTPDSTSGGGSGGFGGSGSISAAPSFSLIQPLDSGEVNTPVQGGGDAVPPIQAQVVSSNVSSGQALDRQVESNSTL